MQPHSTRYFYQNRVQATTPAEAAAKLAAKAEAKDYRVVRVTCHPVPWLVDEWEGEVEIEPPACGLGA